MDAAPHMPSSAVVGTEPEQLAEEDKRNALEHAAEYRCTRRITYAAPRIEFVDIAIHTS